VEEQLVVRFELGTNQVEEPHRSWDDAGRAATRRYSVGSGRGRRRPWGDSPAVPGIPRTGRGRNGRRRQRWRGVGSRTSAARRRKFTGTFPPTRRRAEAPSCAGGERGYCIIGRAEVGPRTLNAPASLPLGKATASSRSLWAPTGWAERTIRPSPAARPFSRGDYCNRGIAQARCAAASKGGRREAIVPASAEPRRSA
jgi:hypothetical protein